MRNALRALTVLRVPAGPVPDTLQSAERREQWAVALFPVIGLLLGLAWGVTSRSIDLYQPTTVAAALILTVDALLTGGRHLVGLGRTADTLGRAWPDDGVGYPGAIAILLVTLLRFSVLMFAADLALLVVTVPIVGRTAMAVLLGMAPLELPGRLGPFAGAGPWPPVVAVVLGCGLATALAAAFGAVAAVTAVVVALVIGVWARRREERWTSDLAYGGALLAETVALLVTVAVR